MSPAAKVQQLSTLVDLREREVDRLSADVASQQALRERYQRNLERMDQLCASTAALPVLSPLQAMNNGAYRLSLLAVADQHRQQLAVHDADMAASRQALHDAARRHEVLSQVLQRQHSALQRAEASRDQKRQDDLAAQVWRRGQA
ncbi:MAG: flagellar export protein FliJ [Proteobacteria bacterium]|uniref:flagellar export protein FliJ n=1 Tax=Aquabacterium sp. TaxID=1872578 RepID=UPI0035C6C368|nr:flagellar export protein FliJ [Pseudomonadota bacterium]